MRMSLEKIQMLIRPPPLFIPVPWDESRGSIKGREPRGNEMLLPSDNQGYERQDAVLGSGADSLKKKKKKRKNCSS